MQTYGTVIDAESTPWQTVNLLFRYRPQNQDLFYLAFVHKSEK